jgi:GLPGLI family protein
MHSFVIQASPPMHHIKKMNPHSYVYHHLKINIHMKNRYLIGLKIVTFYITIAFFSLFINSTSAQNLQVLDHAYIKCFYKYNWIKDTVNAISAKESLVVLQIGEEITKWYGEKAFYMDSLKSTPEGYKKWTGLFNQNWENGAITNMSRDYSTYIYKNYPEGKMTVTDNILTQYFIYEETIEPQDWKILEDTLHILDYYCQKAVCDFRGRSYEAWFAPEIPISEGPWKFYGLPGLILSVNDTRNQYRFEITGLQKTNEPIYFLKSPDKSGKYIKTDRIQFLRDTMGKGRNIGAYIEAETNISFAKSKKTSRKVPTSDVMERDY